MSLTQQNIFDQVVEHLARQKVKSTDHMRCLYRGPNSTQCAFGIFIPDAVYSAFLEGHSSTRILYAVEQMLAGADAQVIAGGLAGNRFRHALTPQFVREMTPLVPHRSFLSELQGVHDSQHGPQVWGQEFEKIAGSRGLRFDREAFEQQMNQQAEVQQ